MSNIQKEKNKIRERRHKRVRAKVSGTDIRPRLSVYRSLNHISVQLIDDATGKTLASANDKDIKKGNKTEKALEVGKLIGKIALDKKITVAVFDKGAFKYHGRVKAVADGAREAGLTI